MKILKRIALIMAFAAIANCTLQTTEKTAIQTNNDQELVGNIAFFVQALEQQKPFGLNLAIHIFLKHEGSETLHEKDIKINAGQTLVFFKNLEPGVYTLSEYSYSYLNQQKTTTLKHPISVQVIPNQTTLFPQIVNMTEIYPGAWFSSFSDGGVLGKLGIINQ